MTLQYTDRSKEDIELSFRWYELQRKGLGFEFLECIEKSINSIISFPEMYQIAYSHFRRCVINKFPFSIFYTVEKRIIVIHSVFDNRQDPEKRP